MFPDLLRLAHSTDSSTLTLSAASSASYQSSPYASGAFGFLGMIERGQPQGPAAGELHTGLPWQQHAVES